MKTGYATPMFRRQIQTVFEERLAQFPVVALTGPRQSGKTTLLETLCKSYSYINLESPEQLEKMRSDPKAMLQSSPNGLIIDEAQRYPEAFSYIQVIADQHKQHGQFILSGSQNFLLSQHITQSLAGRAALLTLLPLTLNEYHSHPSMPSTSLWPWLYQGAYPRPYQENIPSKVWMDNYVQTYLERDVRDLLNVKNLDLFQKCLRMCAARHGQLLNMHQLSIDCGVSHTTIREWVNVLEASYIIFRLPPYHTNFNKRLTKSSKLYFYDSGLVCYLLGIDSPEHLSHHSSRGAIFEGAVISDIKKHYANLGMSQNLYFWRDHNGIEVDCLIESHGELHGFEIKSTSTFRQDLLKGLRQFQKLSGCQQSHLVYAGGETFESKGTHIAPWDQVAGILP